MLVVRRERRIEWGDCDPARIVHNPRFFDWFDKRVACSPPAFKAWLLEHPTSRASRSSVAPRFLQPSRFGDQIVIDAGDRYPERRPSTFVTNCSTAAAGGQAFRRAVWTARHPDDPSRLKSACSRRHHRWPQRAKRRHAEGCAFPPAGVGLPAEEPDAPPVRSFLFTIAFRCARRARARGGDGMRLSKATASSTCR